MNFRDRIYRSFKRILDGHAAREIEYIVDEDRFGNAILLVAVTECRIRFVNDRGDLYIYFSPTDADEWYMFDTLLEFLGRPRGELAGLTDEQCGGILDAEYLRIVQALTLEMRDDLQDFLNRISQRPLI